MNSLIQRGDVLFSGGPVRMQKRQRGSQFAPTIVAFFGKGFQLSILHGSLFVDTEHPSNRSTTPPLCREFLNTRKSRSPSLWPCLPLLLHLRAGHGAGKRLLV